MHMNAVWQSFCRRYKNFFALLTFTDIFAPLS